MLDALSALLGTNIAELNDTLRVVGQELAFLLATDSKAYRLMESIIDDERSQTRSIEKIETLRDYLIKRGSKVLQPELRRSEMSRMPSTPKQRSHGYRM
jgi:hypothetical protein